MQSQRQQLALASTAPRTAFPTVWTFSFLIIELPTAGRQLLARPISEQAGQSHTGDC